MPNIRVAIVEDDAPQAELLSDLLSRFAQEKDFQLTTERFSSAVEMAETYKGQFDILFLDIMMPGQTGMELAHEIRKNDPKTAIIFVTSLSQFAIASLSSVLRDKTASSSSRSATSFIAKPAATPSFTTLPPAISANASP